MRLHNLAGSLTLAAAAKSTTAGQPIVIDTDLKSDVDDVGALAVANVLHNCDFADLKGIVINTRSRYGALAASALCTYFNNGHVPIAAMRPLTDESFFDNYSYTLGEYASKVAYNWPRSIEDAESTPTPVELYRTILNDAHNRTMHIISIGFLTNIAELLKSPPDEISSFSGPDLISAKVSELIIMGGQYPSGWEFNFGGVDVASTIYVLEHWPADVPITFSGAELGGNIYTGQALSDKSPLDSPVLAAYQWYVGRCSTVRESWDPLSVLYGILGLDGFSAFGLETPLAYANAYGYNEITSSNGSNAWINDTSVRNQHWLRLADGVSNSSVAWLLDQLISHGPGVRSCFEAVPFTTDAHIDL